MFATLAGEYPWPDDGGRASDVALRVVLAAQIEAGFGLLSDGRVHDPGGDLAGAWIAARDVAAAIAPALPVKLAVRGPWWASRDANGDAGGGMAADAAADLAASAADLAASTNAGLRVLAAAGCPYVEIHEPATHLPADPAGAAAFGAVHRRLLDGLPEGFHRSLAITAGDASPLGAPAVFDAPYDSHLFDVIGGPDNWRLIAVAPPGRGIVLGVVDATGRRRIGLEEITWAAGYAASSGRRGVVRIGIAPSGSLASLDPERIRESLALLGSAAAALAGDREALLDRLDPRAIDARTAALGHAARKARRRPAR